MRDVALNSPLGYDEDAASSFANLTSSCNATGYDFSIPTPYSQNAPETVQAASADIATPAECPDSYTIKPGDDCHSVARQLNVSSYSLLQQNYLDLYCRSFATAGTAICIPPQCDTYTWLPTDTCESVVSQHTSLSVPQFLAWNPNFNSLCGNSFNFIGYSVCISPPGGFRTYSYPTTPTPTNTTQPGYASTAATVPPNARDNSTRNCGSWHTIVKGDTCATLSLSNSISLSDLQFLNPTLDQNCTTLVLDLAYCVRPVGDIATYPTYTQSDVLDIHVPAACFPPYDPAATALIVNERGAGMNTTASGTGPGPSLTALPLVAEKSAHAKRHFDRRGVDAMDSVVAHAHGIGFGRSVTA
ncbi:unnamed protein product [Zymoseptoria tritici ST99CH_3D1]|nr:unnamed protein product [Zymoseptoria tritici ST99CH_3D1]